MTSPRQKKKATSPSSSRSSRKTTARSAAIDILMELRAEKKPVDLYFNRFTGSLEVKDRNFTKTLVYGVLRQKEYLDYVISRFSRHPLHKMKPKTIIALETGTFQLIFLDRVPHPAAIHATVEALKISGQPRWLLGFVNGVLRNIARAAGSIPSPEAATVNGKPILNHPRWLIDRWVRQFGRQQAEHVCEINNTEPQLSLRVNTRRITREEFLNLYRENNIKAEACVYSPLGATISAFTGSVADLPGFHQGFFQVQDESAQLATMLMGPLEGCRILDACAGLGGKTSHLAQVCSNSCKITAVEPNTRRNALMLENLKRLQLQSMVEQYQGTLEEYAGEVPGTFDAILIDAPCSGTGVIRRQPDIRWHRSEEDFPGYQSNQLQLLETSHRLLKEGGRLVYAVCSIEPEEGPEVVSIFTKKHPEYRIEPAEKLLPATAFDLITDHGFFQPLPSRTHDGFFAAALTKATDL